MLFSTLLFKVLLKAVATVKTNVIITLPRPNIIIIFQRKRQKSFESAVIQGIVYAAALQKNVVTRGPTRLDMKDLFLLHHDLLLKRAARAFTWPSIAANVLFPPRV